MSNQQYRGAQIPDHRADWLNARPPAPVWTENLSCPSSGDARTLLCYAGAGPRYVYRKAKGGEFSMSKGMRWETLTGAAYVDQDTVNIGGSNVTATGNATYLGLACNYITWPAATHNWASSYCGDDHGVAVALGQLVTARLEFAVSRPLVGDETLALNCVAGAASSRTFTAADDIMPGQFYATIINEYVAAATNTPIAIYYNVTGTFATPLTIYMRRRMLFDASGLAASECVPDFVDPAVDYGFGAVGVKWLDTTCGNTVDANGVIIPGTGAAMPEPMGVAWQPAATGLATNSPPTAGAEITVTAAPAAVAGLPAKRITSSVVNTTHVVSIVLSNITGTRSLYAVLKKPTSGDAVPLLNCYNSSWSANIYVLPDWSASAIRDSGSGNIVNHRLTSLGNNDYLLEMVVSQSGQLGQAAELLVVKSESVLSYAGAGEYLDIAAFNVVDQAFSGTPLLASGSQTARIADDPATLSLIHISRPDRPRYRSGSRRPRPAPTASRSRTRIAPGPTWRPSPSRRPTPGSARRSRSRATPRGPGSPIPGWGCASPFAAAPARPSRGRPGRGPGRTFDARPPSRTSWTT